jgi:hypothetical protein
MDEKKTSHPNEFAVPVGVQVMTRDGAELGRVAEVCPGHFKVDAPSARDYWLSTSTIRRPPIGAVELSFDSEQIEDFKQDSPEADAASPVLDDSLQTYESSSDQAATRREWEQGYQAPSSGPDTRRTAGDPR